MVSLRNGAVMRGYDLAIACDLPDRHDEDWYARLSAYLMDFATRVEPDAARRMEDMRYLGEGMNPDGRRYVTAWGTDHAGQSVRMFQVQVEPVFRLAGYTPVDHERSER